MSHEYSIHELCAALDVSRSGYQTWAGRAPSLRARADADLLSLLRQGYQASLQTYGRPRLQHWLAERGHRCGHTRLWRLLRQAGLSQRRRRCSRSTNPSLVARRERVGLLFIRESPETAFWSWADAGGSVFGVAGFRVAPSVCVFLTLDPFSLIGFRSFQVLIFIFRRRSVAAASSARSVRNAPGCRSG